MNVFKPPSILNFQDIFVAAYIEYIVPIPIFFVEYKALVADNWDFPLP